MAVSAITTNLSSSYLSLLALSMSERQQNSVRSAEAPRLAQDEISISQANRPPLPGAAPEGSQYYGQYTADGLALDTNGQAVVVDDRTVLIQSTNGRQIQQWGDILNDTTGRYSDVDKANAYKQLTYAWQDANPNFTFEEKRAAAIVANRSDFAPRVQHLEQRLSSLVQKGLSNQGFVAWYDALAPWEQAFYAGRREAAEAMQFISDGLERRAQTGAYKSGDPNPSDPEARWLLHCSTRSVSLTRTIGRAVCARL
jgi:hypothetical protein